MKKILFILLFASAGGYSQQLLKRVTETDASYIVELFYFRNGNGCDVSGAEAFNWSVGQYGYFSYGRMVDGTPEYFQRDPNFELEAVTMPDWPLGGETFHPMSAFGRRTYHNIGSQEIVGEQEGEYVPVLQLTTETLTGSYNNQGQSFPSLFYGKIVLPKIQNDGVTPIPEDLWVMFWPWDAYYYILPDTTNSIHVGEKFYSRFNGSTWTDQSTDMEGNPVPLIRDICSALSAAEIAALPIPSLAPNPASSFIALSVPGDAAQTDYTVVDQAGRTVLSGNFTPGQKISIEGLALGTYILKSAAYGPVRFIKQ